MTVALPLVALVAAACGGQASESEAEDASGSCYEGQTVDLVVSYGPGGGYDTLARTAAPFLEEELGATVVVQNEAGAGGLQAANSIYTAEPDGLTFGLFSGQGLVGSVLGGAEGVQFEVSEFTYLGRLANEPRVLSVGAGTPFETIGDVQAADEFRFASSGPGGSDHIDATVLFPVLDINGEIITGYSGSAETELAVISGDADGNSGTVGTRLSAIENGDTRPVLVMGTERSEELPDVQILPELDLAPEQAELAQAYLQLQDIGRAVLGPPGIPDDCRQELESAFEAVWSDEEFLQQAEEAGQQGLGYLPGDELREIVESVLDSPEEFRTLLQQAYTGQ